MSTPIKPIKVLVLEDVKLYADAFSGKARKAQILTEIVDNVDDLLLKITTSPKKYQFLVLDARAYMHEGDKEGDEDEMNLITVVQELDKLKYESGIYIPYCINTAFADLKLRLGKKVACKIFEKGHEDELFKYIWETYNSADAVKIRFQYPNVFAVADEHFSEQNIGLLSKLLIDGHYDSNNIGDRVRNLGTLRVIAEHLMDILHAKYLSGVPDVSRDLGRRLGTIVNYMNEQHDLPVHINGTLTSIRKTASEFGNHTPQQASSLSNYPTNNTIAGLTFCLFDVFSWAKTKLPVIV
jgi:hypothetical protein